MKVRKKNDQLQDFDIEKIRLSLKRLSDDQGQPFTGSDLRYLTDAIERNIKKLAKDVVTSQEILEIVLDKLEEFGFKKLRDAYWRFGECHK